MITDTSHKIDRVRGDDYYFQVPIGSAVGERPPYRICPNRYKEEVKWFELDVSEGGHPTSIY